MPFRKIFPLILLLTLPILILGSRVSYGDSYSREATREEKRPRIYYAVRSENTERTRTKSYEEEVTTREEEQDYDQNRDYDEEEEEEAPKMLRKPTSVYNRNRERTSSGYRTSSERVSPERGSSRYSSERESSERLSPERGSNRYSSERESFERLSPERGSNRYSSERESSERLSPERESSSRYSSEGVSPGRSSNRQNFERLSPERSGGGLYSSSERFSPESGSYGTSGFRASPVDDLQDSREAKKSHDCLQTQLLTALTENKMLMKQQRQQQQPREQPQRLQQARQQVFMPTVPITQYPGQMLPNQRLLPTVSPPQVYINNCPQKISKVTPEKTMLLNWIMKNGQHKIFGRSARSVKPEDYSQGNDNRRGWTSNPSGQHKSFGRFARSVKPQDYPQGNSNRRGWTPNPPNATTRTARSSYYSPAVDPYYSINKEKPSQQYSMPIVSPQPSLPRVSVPQYALLDSDFVNVGDFQDIKTIVNKLKTEFPPMERPSTPVTGDDDYQESMEDDYEEEDHDLRANDKYSNGKVRFEEEEKPNGKYGKVRFEEEEETTNKYGKMRFEEEEEKENSNYKYEKMKFEEKEDQEKDYYGKNEKVEEKERGKYEEEKMTPQQYEEKTREELRKYKNSYGDPSYYEEEKTKPKESSYYEASKERPNESGGYSMGIKEESRERPRPTSYEGTGSYSHQMGPNGEYNVEYSTDTIKSKERGYMKPVRTRLESVRSNGEKQDTLANFKMGSVSWTSPEGYTFHLTYEADERGYRPLLTQTSTVPSHNIRKIDRRNCWSFEDDREIMLPEEERGGYSTDSIRKSSRREYGSTRTRELPTRGSSISITRYN